jgi:hypothetical protein
VSFPTSRLDLVTEIFVNGGWVDVSNDVRVANGDITITGGLQSEDGQAPPGRSTFVLDNTSGNYSPRNALGAYHGSIGLNTPVTQAVRQDRDAFARTVSNGWGSTDTGLAWTTGGAGGTVQASDFAVAAGVGTHSVPTTSAHRRTMLDDVEVSDVDLRVTVQMAFSNVTGGDVEPANLLFRGVGSDYYMVRVVITSAEAVTVKLMNNGGTTYAGPVTVAGLTHSGQALRVRGQMEGQTFRAKVWAAASPEPFAWTVTGRVPDAPRAGWVGVRSGVASANSNASPVVFSYDGWELRRPRFAGESGELPPRWDLAVVDWQVPVEANGILRRLGRAASPLQSALRRSIPTAPGLVAYWPLEDGEDSTVFASALPGGTAMDINGPVDLAAFDGFKASAPLPQLNLGGWTGRPPDYPATGVIQLRFLLAVPSGGAPDGAVLVRITTTGTALTWELSYSTGGGLRLRAFNNIGTELLNSVTGFNLNGALVRVSLELWHNGANTNWMISTLGVGSSSGGFVTNTVSTVTVGRALVLQFAPFAGLDDVAIGHVSLQNVQTSLFDLAAELAAFDGETAGNRVIRLCGENGVSIAMFGDPDDSAAMGPQGVATLLDLLAECERADLGTLYESRGELGLAFRTRSSKYNQDARAEVDYAAKQLAPPFEPIDDDEHITNDFTARRPSGSSQRVEVTTGRMSTADPADGGAGRYAGSDEFNVESDLQLRDTAAWVTHLGTVDEPRYPVIAVDLAGPHVAGTALAARILDVGVDDRIDVINTGELKIYDGVSQIARGYTETLGEAVHKITLNCVPASPWQVIELDDTGSRLDSSSSTLDIAVTDSATTLSVVSTAERWTTTDVPCPITIGGEDMSATSIGSSVPAFVAAGTAAHADNAPVAPGLPAGLQAGDLLLILAAARNAGVGVPVAPAGYAELGAVDNLKLFGKYAAASEATPTVTFSGTVAGATCSAQTAAFRGVSVLRAAADGGANASAQNIAFPMLNLPFGPSLLVLHMGWKQDDWTSVATLSGATEIGEPSSTLGDDQGLVWDYRTVTDAKGAIDAGSFTVTGGASAVSCSMAVALYATQAFTVTRAVNGVAKAHAAGDEVHVHDRVNVAL